MNQTHHTAPTRFIEAAGVSLAYRRFGEPRGTPLVMLQHFTGTMDNWDPLVTDGLAGGREVILFNNAGVSSSGGEPATTIQQAAAYAAAFIDALGLKQVDVLGFSMSGFVAQQLALARPSLVRRLVLVGTGPRGGQGMSSLTPEAQAIFSKQRDVPDELWLDVMFSPSDASQAAGRAFLHRLRARQDDPPATDKVAPAQIAAITEWGAPRADSFAYLKEITQPTLVTNGDKDVIIYPINSWSLAQNLPNAQLIIYPDAGHGAQMQYPELFVRHVDMFLDGALVEDPFARAAARYTPRVDGPAAAPAPSPANV